MLCRFRTALLAALAFVWFSLLALAAATPNAAAQGLATNTPRPTRTPTYSAPPTNTPRLAHTPTPSLSSTPTPIPEPTLVIFGTYATPMVLPPTAIPLSAPLPEYPEGDDILTILLLGSDTTERNLTQRTDVMVVVVINRTAGSVSMLHLPRDLYVYAPNDTMRKLNTVADQGIKMYGAGGGSRLIKETLQYNFGIKVDFYARVGFTEFQEIIEALGGLTISVDCAIQGNRLKEPDLDIYDPDSYEVYTLNIGRHTLDPYMALWYVRARGSSSDIDRGRRQMEVLTAIWRQARSAGLLTQATVLVPELLKIVETDMNAADLIGLVPLALSLEPANVQQIVLQQNVHFRQWYTTDTSTFTWLPNTDGMREAVQNLYTPPTRNRLSGENPRVVVAAASVLSGYDQVAADRLAAEGFRVMMLGTEGAVNRGYTALYDYSGGAMPQSLEIIRRALRISEELVISEPNPNAPYDFRVDIGHDYYQSCLYSLPEIAPAEGNGE